MIYADTKTGPCSTIYKTQNSLIPSVETWTCYQFQAQDLLEQKTSCFQNGWYYRNRWLFCAVAAMETNTEYYIIAWGFFVLELAICVKKFFLIKLFCTQKTVRRRYC